MTLVDGPDTVQSESTGNQTGNGDHGDPANTDAPEGDPGSLEHETVQDQEGLQEDHPSPADGDLELDVNEDREEVTFEGDYLPVLNDIGNTPRSQTVEENQEVPQYERLANEMDEKLEKILQSVQRTSGHRDSVPASSPDDAWSINSQRQLRFDEPKPKVVFFEPETISRGPTRRDSQAWNEVINDASKQAEVHKTPGKQDLANFSTRNKVLQQKQIVIDGDYVTLLPTAKSHGELGVRLFKKQNRSKLSPEGLDYFRKSLISYVLPKDNKLSTPAITDTEGHLKAVSNLDTQLGLIRRHFEMHDCIDVFSIVIPHGDLMTDPGLREVTSLFTSYPRLHVDIVANSNTWYHTWAMDPCYAENLNFTYEMLRKNTADELWLKCQEDYDEFSPAQRGGPLMLFLILRRIQDVSEAAIDHVKAAVVHLKIREIPGENVDKAVSLIKAAYSLFRSASSPCHSYIPDDFNKTILLVFQTSSVHAFNNAFKQELTEAQHLADKTGKVVEWPSISELTKMATAIYHRLLASNKWHATAQTRRKALLGAGPTTSQAPPRDTSQLKCFNCGEHGHSARECSKPRDSATFKKNLDAFRKAKRERGMRSDGRSSHPRPRETRSLNGVPEVKNKNGKFVPDQKALKAARDAAYKAQLADELSAALAEPTSSQPGPAAQPSGLVATEQPTQVRFDATSRASSRKQAITAVLSRLRPT
jgi:Zinc knuckle